MRRPPEVVEAVVHVGAEETPYLRSGRGGEPLIVLAEEDAERLRLVRLLAPRFRVFAPSRTPAAFVRTAGPAEPPLDPGAVGSWLCDVLDGLGVERPRVVLSSDLVPLAEGLRLLCSGMVGRVVVAGDGGDDALLAALGEVGVSPGAEAP